MNIPDYNPNLMTMEDIHTILMYYDIKLLYDKKNFPTDRHLRAKVWDIKEDPQLGNIYIHYVFGLDTHLNSKKSPLNIWNKKQIEEIKKLSPFEGREEKLRAHSQKYAESRKQLRIKWAEWFKKTKEQEQQEIGYRSYRSVDFLKGA